MRSLIFAPLLITLGSCSYFSQDITIKTTNGEKYILKETPTNYAFSKDSLLSHIKKDRNKREIGLNKTLNYFAQCKWEAEKYYHESRRRNIGFSSQGSEDEFLKKSLNDCSKLFKKHSKSNKDKLEINIKAKEHLKKTEKEYIHWRMISFRPKYVDQNKFSTTLDEIDIACLNPRLGPTTLMIWKYQIKSQPRILAIHGVSREETLESILPNTNSSMPLERLKVKACEKYAKF